jgi:hypothetical protein
LSDGEIQGKNPSRPCGGRGAEETMSAHYWVDAALAGFGVLIFIIGVALYFVHGWQRLKVDRSKVWPSVVGTVTSSALERAVPKGNTFRAVVCYRYHVAGKDYESNRVSWGSQEGRETDMAEIVETYPVGKDVWVQHDPRDPANAVLLPEINAVLRPLFGYALALMLLGLIAIGAGLYALSH